MLHPLMTRIHIELTRCFRLRTFYSRTIHRQLPPIPIHNLAPPHTTTNTRALLPERPFRWASEWGSMMILRKKRVNRHRDIIVEKYSPEKPCGCAVGRGCPFRGSSSNSQIKPSSQQIYAFGAKQIHIQELITNGYSHFANISILFTRSMAIQP